ncbi:MAG: hypothetical protein IKZ91_04365 [Bacteroidales bacterium]|nr:hypothetical protein [Bacteroidales bacterium]
MDDKLQHEKQLCLWILLLFSLPVFGQERVSVKGRIINQHGKAVEYVQVGIPKLQLGTISSADGLFELTAPCDTLEFFHVSFQTERFIVTGPADDVVITLRENELPPAVFVGGDTKEKYLLRPGTKVFGNGGVLVFEPKTGSTKGVEIGSVAQTKKPFLVQDIQFGILHNSIPDCVVSVNIYLIEGKDEAFVNVLQKPIYVKVAESEHPQEFHIQPEETILLEPGRYYISFQIVDCNEKALEEYLQVPESERDWSQMRLSTILYFKSSYARSATMGKMEHYPVNIGMVVKGLEYQ